MYGGMMWRVASLSFLILFPGLESVTLCREQHFSIMPGVPTIAPVHSTTVARKAGCAKTCMQLAGCQSFSFRSGPLGCRLFPRRIMALDLVGSSLDVHFSKIWVSCPTWKGYVTVPGTTKCILVGNVASSWTQAKDICGADGGHLLIIENAEVMQKLQNFLSQGWYQVGFNDLDTEDRYLWLDGTPVNRSLFYITEPNDHVYDYDTEDCGVLGVRVSHPGLNDASCNFEALYLCSLPLRM